MGGEKTRKPRNGGRVRAKSLLTTTLGRKEDQQRKGKEEKHPKALIF